jgi:hypothetical protein
LLGKHIGYVLLIYTLQATFHVHGPNATWSYINKIAPAIPTLCALTAHIEATVNAYRCYSKHSSPKAEQDIQLLADYFFINKFHVADSHCNGNNKDVAKDFSSLGSVKLNKPDALKNFHHGRT